MGAGHELLFFDAGFLTAVVQITQNAMFSNRE